MGWHCFRIVVSGIAEVLDSVCVLLNKSVCEISKNVFTRVVVVLSDKEGYGC